MGRRKKSVALNQSSIKPVEEPIVEEPIVATPEQIEEIKKAGAEDIAKLVDEKIQEDLQELADNVPAKLLAPELESVVPLAEPPVELEDIGILREGAGFVYGEDYVEDPNIERTLVDKRGPTDEELIKGLPEIQKKLSVADKRKKLRHGMKPPTH